MEKIKNLGDQFIEAFKKCRISPRNIRKTDSDAIAITYSSPDWLGFEFHRTDENENGACILATFNFRGKKLKKIRAVENTFSDVLEILKEAELTHVTVSCGDSTTLIFIKDKVVVSRTPEFQAKSDSRKFEGEIDFPISKLFDTHNTLIEKWKTVDTFVSYVRH